MICTYCTINYLKHWTSPVSNSRSAVGNPRIEKLSTENQRPSTWILTCLLKNISLVGRPCLPQLMLRSSQLTLSRLHIAWYSALNRTVPISPGFKANPDISISTTGLCTPRHHATTTSDVRAWKATRQGDWLVGITTLRRSVSRPAFGLVKWVLDT